MKRPEETLGASEENDRGARTVQDFLKLIEDLETQIDFF